jgi:hypothetical protein
MVKTCVLSRVFAQVFVLALLVACAVAQETTGGLQGLVKDPSSAVVAHAQVVVTSPSLVGTKEAETDGNGYFRFANLPPGTYTITVTAKGFTTAKRENLTLEVGHLPTVDFTLKVGASETVVEVSAEGSQVDVTTTHTLTNITSDVVTEVPHGISFQSVIQFAPAARNEPLAGNNAPGGTGAGAMTRPGTGGGSPGSTSNGGGLGFQVAGGADSENRYLVEGQDTANVIGGYSHTDVPFDFIDEVQVKTSGIEAEHGGAMGGVVNVIMKHGSNAWHGSLGMGYNAESFNANQNTAFLRYDPQGTGDAAAGNDPAAQTYRQAKNHFRYVQPLFTVGGPIMKDRLWMFVGLEPKYLSTSYRVNYGANQNNAGLQTFNQDQQTYFTTVRLDATVTQKLRVYASWLYQLQRESGAVLPVGDSTTGLFNPASTTPLFVYSHSYGYVAPNQTLNIGADLALSSKLVATTRFGYFFENYHDFGFPSGGSIFFWSTPGTTGAPDSVFDNCVQPCTPNVPLPGSLQQTAGFVTAGNDQNFTLRNASKHHQFSQDIAWFQGGRFGTHNLKFGYQLNHVSNDIFQRWNAPAVFLSVGAGNFFSPGGDTGTANCAPFVALYGNCAGQLGFLNVEDYGSYGYASSFNHSVYVQDAWTIGRGITINAGLRVEKEYLPGETTAGGFPAKPIQFGWGDKIAPRFGAAWDVFKDGRMKVFGSYGVYNDLMKLNLAISSFGGQYWQNCFYAVDSNGSNSGFDPSQINVVFGAGSRYCTGDSTGGANFAGGTVPAGLTFLENQNFRGTEGVAPGLKPYRQHESAFGVDYAIKRNLAIEARWDRRRLDHAIEDAATFDNTGSETFLIVNPGFGANARNLASSCTDPAGPGCPPNIKAARSYDGVELRLTKAASKGWFGMFSYTYSSLRGNYAGLTSTDLADGGGGRNAPNNSRSFDESFFQYNANGGSSSGPLATDRPHAFKGYGYYRIPWKGGWTSTNIGWFQTLYSGTPKSTYTDVGFSFSQPPFSGGFPVYPEGRGRWVNITSTPTVLTNPAYGSLVNTTFNAATVSSICSCRTPWYIQSDASFRQEFKLSKTHEAQVLTFEATIPNLFNQQRVTAYYAQLDTAQFQSYLTPGQQFSYAAFEHPYDWKALLNPNNTNQTYFAGPGNTNPFTNPIVPNSLYGKPLYYQQGRSIRLAVRYTF